jgi:hypothetical protein
MKVHIMEIQYIKEFQSNSLLFQTYEQGNTRARIDTVMEGSESLLY